MTHIDSVLVSDVEKAFGLNKRDVKLVGSPECAPLLKQNGWCCVENAFAKLHRFEVIRHTSLTNTAQLVVWFGNPIFEFPEGGKIYKEKVLFGLFRLYNLHVEYRVVGWIDEYRRLVQPVFPWHSADKKVDHVTDLALSTLCDDKLNEDEVVAWYLEGPTSEEYISHKDNLGKFLATFKSIDMKNDIRFWTPRWLKNRAKEVNQKKGPFQPT
eukprot:TCONS_00010168-protein